MDQVRSIKLQKKNSEDELACVQTSPISFVALGKGIFPDFSRGEGAAVHRLKTNSMIFHKLCFAVLCQPFPIEMT